MSIKNKRKILIYVLICNEQLQIRCGENLLNGYKKKTMTKNVRCQ